jgi:glycosyltransferase involved in cell wall biosynthesis
VTAAVTPDISVVICTHNPRADYVGRTLAALRAQTLPVECWELVVIDNCSEPPLSGRVAWHPAARVVREETLGLTAARLRGIRETAAELLIFVDDDNVLDPDFLEVALRVAEEKPFLGSWSGQCRGGFEQPPPDWTRRYWGNLVIREFDQDRWSNLPRLADSMPCGAGLCVRREVAQAYLRLHKTGARNFQLDRTGGSFLSGGDNDLAACACDIGLGVGIIARLKLTHLIPPERLTKDYLSRLAEGIHFSSVVLDHMRASSAELAFNRIRWHEPLRACLMRDPHRAIQRAAIRGRRKGLEFVHSVDGTHA